MKIRWLLIILIPTILFAEDDVIRKDDLFENRSNFKDGSYIRQDDLFKNRWDQYDREGKKQGTWRQDDLFKNRWNFRKDPDYEKKVDDEN